jgi:hypothetical protein
MIDLLDVFELGNKYIPTELKDDDPRLIKMNIIDDDGSSEGIWVYIKNPEDIDKYNNGTPNDKFEVILLNQPLTHLPVLRRGFVVMAKGNGTANRPILDNDWYNMMHDKLISIALAEQNAEGVK